MSALWRALPIALLIASAGLGASAAPHPWTTAFHWDQLKPQYWQPQAKVLTASLKVPARRAHAGRPARVTAA